MSQEIYNDLLNAANRYAVALNMSNFSYGVMDTKRDLWVETNMSFDDADEMAYKLNEQTK